MTLFESVFAGNDAVYGLTEGAINQAIEKYGADKAVSFPDTAYSLPCYYAVTGTKVGTLAELKDALAVVKTLSGGSQSRAIENEIHQCITDLFLLRKEVLKLAGGMNGNHKTH